MQIVSNIIVKVSFKMNDLCYRLITSSSEFRVHVSWVLFLVNTRLWGFDRTRQTLILSTPGGLIGALSTLALGWYADKRVITSYLVCLLSNPDILCQNERMLPIVFSIIPTLVGAAMLIGLNGSREKGALLFGTNLLHIYFSSQSDKCKLHTSLDSMAALLLSYMRTTLAIRAGTLRNWRWMQWLLPLSASETLWGRKFSNQRMHPVTSQGRYRF